MKIRKIAGVYVGLAHIGDAYYYASGYTVAGVIKRLLCLHDYYSHNI